MRLHGLPEQLHGKSLELIFADAWNGHVFGRMNSGEQVRIWNAEMNQVLDILVGTARHEGHVALYILGFFVVELVLAAKKFDGRAWVFNWSYWPWWIVGNTVAAVALQNGAAQRVQRFATHHGLLLRIGELHPVFQVLLALFTFDIFYYWFHRLQHTPVLWPQHAVHHSDPNINATTAFRHHWLENLVKIPIVDLPMMFITTTAVWSPTVSIPEKILIALVTYLGLFAHANLRIGFGPLNWLIVTPQTHRIHHSIEKRHVGHNFAAYFPLIDVIFGTYYGPTRREFPDTGVAELGRSLNHPLAIHVYPFRTWIRQIHPIRSPTQEQSAEPVL